MDINEDYKMTKAKSCYHCQPLVKENEEQASHIQHLEQRLAEVDKPDCEWVDETENEDYWITSCGYEFTILDGGNPEENNFLYCNFCGGKITTNEV